MFVWKDLGWWYWLGSATLLSAALTGHAWGYTGAVALGVVQVVHFWVRNGSVDAFPVQVRVWFLALLLAGLLPGLEIINWLQLAGTMATLVWDYCLLARLVALLPGNREAPFSLRFVWRTITHPPVQGSIQRHLNGPNWAAE